MAASLDLLQLEAGSFPFPQQWLIFFIPHTTPGSFSQLSCSAHPFPACCSVWDYPAPGAQLGTLLDVIDTLQYFEEHSCSCKNKSLKSVEVFKAHFPYGGLWDNSA